MLRVLRLLLHVAVIAIAVLIGRDLWQQARNSDAMKPCIVVIGGGLAGVSTVIQAIETAPLDSNVHVIVVDKEPRLGGNSMKASSGINSYTPANGDTLADFAKDTAVSGGGFSKDILVSTLVENSAAAIEFLEQAGIDLSSTVQMGGHKHQRTHTNRGGPNVGFAIMKALLSRLDSLTSTKPNITLEQLTSAKVTGLAAENAGWAVTIQIGESAPPRVLHASSVVLATGGFGANISMLRQYAPTAADAATTNGAFATGDGIQLGTQAGAALVDMDKVQIHPTGFVDPKDPKAGTKFLAPEKLRGVGGVLLNEAGRRFVDELHRRDHVTKAIQSLPNGAAWLLLDEEAANHFGAAPMGFYVAKGLATKLDDLSELSAHMSVPQEVLHEEVEQYNAAAASGEDAFDKTVFPRAVSMSGPYYAMRITPVVHYCMGGVAFNEKAEILDGRGQPIPGLFAAGEVTGGLHGANRLGGNSLLECAVFGRIAGTSALQHALTHQ